MTVAPLLVGLWTVMTSATADATPTAPDLAVLTPAVPATIEFRHSQILVQPLPILEPFVTAAKTLAMPMTQADARDTTRLNERAASDGYSPAAALAAALLASFQATSRSAVAAPVLRSPRGGPGPIRFDELPEGRPAPVLLDVSVIRLMLAGGWTDRFYPSLSATYRLVDPRGGLIRPSRVLRSYHRPPTEACPKDETLLCLEPDRECQFDGIADVEASAPRVWRCFDKLFQALADRISADRALNGG